MNIQEIVNSGTAVQIVVNVLDLKEAFIAWNTELNNQKQQQPEDKLVPLEDVIKLLRVDKTTLWRWHKTGYLVKSKVGRKVYYKMSDVEKLMED
ncbi:hypothetical protein EVA_22235 [gut metagenome]|uniref:Helix-turn-helix domain-containing protein n=1 Tax=gut metagenome TaxID=749906 RepID=J9BPZ7_9ZZZZ